MNIVGNSFLVPECFFNRDYSHESENTLVEAVITETDAYKTVLNTKNCSRQFVTLDFKHLVKEQIILPLKEN